MNFKILIALIFVPLLGISQNIQELTLDEYIEAFSSMSERSKNDMSFKVSYKSFENHTTDVPYDIFNGFYAQKGDEQEVMQLGAYIYQDGKNRYVVDTLKKTIKITNSDPSQKAFQDFMKNKTYMNDNHIEKILAKSSENKMVYTIKLKNYRYNKIVVITGEKFIKKVVMFFDKPVFDKSGEEVKKYYPRIELEFFEVNLNQPVRLKKIFDPQKDLRKTNNQFTALGQFASYKVFDARIKNK